MPPLPFVAAPGINDSDTTFAARGQWADSFGVRFRDGVPETIGGEQADLYTITLGGSGNSVNYCLDLFVMLRSGSSVVAHGLRGVAGSGAKLYIYTGSLDDETPASIGTNADMGWCFQAWGETLLAAGRGFVGTPGGRLYEQTGSSTATHVTQAPARNTCILVTNERQVLSFGCNEEVSGTFNGLCIRGSDFEDYTDWTTTATNGAFEHILDGTGQIVAAHKLGQFIGVWTTTALYLGQFIGDPAQMYRFDKVADNCAPVSVRGVTVLNGVAYWFDLAKALRVWAPGQIVATIPNPARADIDQQGVSAYFIKNNTMFAVANPTFGEIWLYDNYGNALTGNYGGYYVYCVNESAAAGRPVWFKGNMARARTAISYSANLGQPNGLAVAEDGDVYNTDVYGTCLANSYITSADFYLNEGQRRAMARWFNPDVKAISSTASLTLTINMRDYPQATASTSGPHAFTTATTKVDFRASGKIMSFKIQSTDTDAWRLGRPVFDVVTMGER